MLYTCFLGIQKKHDSETISKMEFEMPLVEIFVIHPLLLLVEYRFHIRPLGTWLLFWLVRLFVDGNHHIRWG